MYGHSLSAPEEFFGPPRPGQTYAQFQQQMIHPAVMAGAAATALLVNPLAGVVVLGLGWMMGGTGPTTKRKSSTQGG